MPNESGRWTAEEIYHEYGSFRNIQKDKVFYPADKAVLKEEIEKAIERITPSKSAIGKEMDARVWRESLLWLKKELGL